MAQLRIENLTKRFSGQIVTRDVSLVVDDGAFCVFVGPSGCGKSTLLRLIAGLESADSGRIFVDGRDVTDAPAYDRDLAMVFQTYALYPHMSVRDNIAFALRTAKRPEPEVAAKVAEAARILQLEPWLDRKPATLSGGQRQRVAIGRAIVKAPKLFLFDEPLSNLDADLRVHMRVEIARLHKNLGATIIYVTHDQVEAMTLATKIVVLRDGRIEQMGSPLQLYDDPDTVFVAGFIGSPKMNFLTARLQGGYLMLSECDGQKIRCPEPGLALAEGAGVTVGLRPQVLGRTGDQSLEVTVEIVEHFGSDSLVHARPAGSARLLTALVDNGRELAPGQKLEARFRTEDLLFFDQAGQRIR
ncbi:MAG: ABC transporter ATP-binding protein [Rhodobacter sp.]|nr:ABC transporter ATP-binding protein [Rhodobacter sp.]MCA3518934.1 ABC transporter ATP-binding protein [Rhodobacter sp.]MCA3524522.1 ABC transporter ATP-binding protein [Rhodobacter sp.]MCA3527528.1 ABC transporter ATP-binding protein [Rhodobacter sp.]MCA3530539.1 ABC transporter ATP-binding protein [Rhodobacter sp.]